MLGPTVTGVPPATGQACMTGRSHIIYFYFLYIKKKTKQGCQSQYKGGPILGPPVASQPAHLTALF